MAVPAGRSVVFVTGNAKKLEEVTVRYLSPARGCALRVVLPLVVRLRKDAHFLDAFVLVESVFAKFTQSAWAAMPLRALLFHLTKVRSVRFILKSPFGHIL